MFITNPQRILSHPTILTIALTFLLASPAIGHAQVKTGTAAETAPYTAAEVITKTNEARVAEGLPTLATSTKLMFAAQLKASHMVANRYFGHWSPDGKTPWDFIDMAGYNYRTAGENLAIHFMQTDSLVEVWLNSPAHRANLLSPNFKETGIAVVYGEKDGEKGWIVVQMFGTAF